MLVKNRFVYSFSDYNDLQLAMGERKISCDAAHRITSKQITKIIIPFSFSLLLIYMFGNIQLRYFYSNLKNLN
jgi:hypothetical protein